MCSLTTCGNFTEKIVVFFLFHFLNRGHLICKTMEIGIKEETIVLISKHYKAHFDF